MKKISNVLKKDWFILILIVFGFGFGAYSYKSLPNKIPVHWNAAGDVTAYGNKYWASIIFPLTNLGIYLFFVVIPYIDPRRKNFDNFKSTYQYIKYILITLFFAIEIISFLIAKNIASNNPVFIQVMISLLFILIGNVMGRIKNNYFIGIRTPWTLSSDEIWKKTHRLAGPIWVVGGIINILLALTNMNFGGKGFITILIVICGIPLLYSYILYLKIFNLK